MKLKVSLGIGLVGCVRSGTIEVDDYEISECETQEEIDDLCESYYQDWASDYIYGHWELEEKSDV